VINPEALSRFSSCFPGKITDAFNSLARKSNFRAISKKLGLVRPHGAAGRPHCPRARWCWDSSGILCPGLQAQHPRDPGHGARAAAAAPGSRGASPLVRGSLRASRSVGTPAEACPECPSLLQPCGPGPCPEYRPSPQIPRVDGEYDLKVPRDMAYVFSGAYVPLSCKIIEQVSPPAPGSTACVPRAPASLGGPAGVPGAGSAHLPVGASLRWACA